MLRNKDRLLAGNARQESQQIAFNSSATDRAAEQLRFAGQDFAHWLDDLDDQQLIEKLPNLTERLDYIYTLTVNVQKAAVKTILTIHAIRETLEKLDIRAKNRQNQEEDGEC